MINLADVHVLFTNGTVSVHRDVKDTLEQDNTLSLVLRDGTVAPIAYLDHVAVTLVIEH